MSSDILTARLESIYLMSNNTGENGTECQTSRYNYKVICC